MSSKFSHSLLTGLEFGLPEIAKTVALPVFVV